MALRGSHVSPDLSFPVTQSRPDPAPARLLPSPILTLRGVSPGAWPGLQRAFVHHGAGLFCFAFWELLLLVPFGHLRLSLICPIRDFLLPLLTPLSFILHTAAGVTLSKQISDLASLLLKPSLASLRLEDKTHSPPQGPCAIDDLARAASPLTP